MVFLRSIKYILLHLKAFLSANYRLAQYKSKYPTCEFYLGAMISDSQFGEHNVLFDNVIVAGCKVGSHTYIQKRSTIFNAEIGKFCSIGTYVSIGPGIHKTDGVSTHPAFYLRNTPLAKSYAQTDLFQSSKKTIIGNDVWIGEGAIIIDGLNVGNGAIIAAGAVVTKDVIPYSVVGGVPAKLIKMRFDEDVANQINSSAWWEKPEEWLEKNYSIFADTALFLKNMKS